MIKHMGKMSLSSKALLINMMVSFLIVTLFGSVLWSYQRQQQHVLEHRILKLASNLNYEMQSRQQAIDNQIALLSHNEAVMDRLFDAEMENNASTLPLPEDVLSQLQHDLFRVFSLEGNVVAMHGLRARVIPLADRNKAFRGFVYSADGLLYVNQWPVVYDKKILGYVALGDRLDKKSLATLAQPYENHAVLQLLLGKTVLIRTGDNIDDENATYLTLGKDVKGLDVSLAIDVDRHAMMHENNVFMGYVVLALLLSASAWWFLYSRLIGQIIVRLQHTQERLAKFHIGDVFPAPEHHADALDDIDQGLHSMSRRLQMKTEKLQLERQTLLTIADTAPIWIWQTDAAGRFIFANKQMRSILQIDDPTDFLMHDLVQLEGEGRKLEPLNLDRECDAVYKVRVNQQWHDLHIMTVRQSSSGGRLFGLIGVAVDVSKLRKLEANYRQAQKMEALGTLVGGVAHNFNNLLAGMVGNIYLAKNKSKHHPAVLNHLDKLAEASTQATDMIKQLLVFVHQDMGAKDWIELNDLTRDAIDLIQLCIPADIHLHVEMSHELMTTHGNATVLEQMLKSLIINARDALVDVAAAGHNIIVRLERLPVDALMQQQHPRLQGDFIACLSVQDNGSGIADDNIALIFDPFFTTKEVGKGAGLGLSMAIGAAESMGGWIDVDSELGVGSKFFVYLPLRSVLE